ncbi:hypothetical protein T265_16049, partial [Opisthorchis viverrini]
MKKIVVAFQCGPLSAQNVLSLLKLDELFEN